MAHHQVNWHPDVVEGDQVVFQPLDHNGMLSEANAVIKRIDGAGMADLTYTYDHSPNGKELTTLMVAIPYASDGKPQTWHEVGA